MGARKRKAVDAPKQVRIRKRPRRTGPRRAINVSLTAEHARKLDLDAARNLTSIGEIVMDALDMRWSRKPVEPDAPAA